MQSNVPFSIRKAIFYEQLRFSNCTNFLLDNSGLTEYFVEVKRDGNFWYTFVVEGIGVCFVSIIGCFCNLLAIYVVVKSFSGARNLPDRIRQKNQDIKSILIALALSDLLFLITEVAIFGLPAISQWYNTFVYPFILPKL